MKKYQLRHPTFEAEQWQPGSLVEGVYGELTPNGDPRYYVVTPAERVYLEPGDWIVKELRYHTYSVMKPTEFAKTYTPMPEPV